MKIDGSEENKERYNYELKEIRNQEGKNFPLYSESSKHH